MSKREIIEVVLMLGAAILTLIGAVLIEPAVMVVGTLAAAAAAVMRFNDRRSATASD